MLKAIGLMIFILHFGSAVHARTEEITGTATSNDEIVYIEKHKVEYSDDGKLLHAETRYESSEGKLLALLIDIRINNAI